MALPIGNLGDLSQRAREGLETAKYILCEDTRQFKKLTQLAHIKTSYLEINCFHDHSQDDKIQWAMDILAKGQDLALVSDAGSPIISDPAYPLVRRALDEGHTLDSCPGPSSLVCALELAGLPPIPLHFHGFLPKAPRALGQALEEMSHLAGTHLAFESPFRLKATVGQLVERVDGPVEVVVCREMTKLHQQVLRAPAAQWGELLQRATFMGECVLMFHIPKGPPRGPGPEMALLAQKVLQRPGRTKDLAKLLGACLGRSPKELYRDLEKKSFP